MAKVLSIAWYKVLPPKYGGQKGIACFNEYLGRKTSLTCLCSKNNESTRSLSYTLLPGLPVSKWQFLNPFTWRKIMRVAKKEKPTHIILEHPYHAIAGWLAKKRTVAKLIIHSHNIEYLRFREQGKWWWRLLRSYERWAHRKADLSFFKTEQELNSAVAAFRLKRESCLVVPYAPGTGEKKPDRSLARKLICEKYGLPGGEKIILFAGTLDYNPNAKAVQAIYEEIVPRLEALHFTGKIIICGRNTLKEFQYLKQFVHPLVIQAGEVDNIEDHFAAADVFISPVITGGGVQTKIVDALSLGCKIVCFSEKLPPGEFRATGSILSSASGEGWDPFIANIQKALYEPMPANDHIGPTWDDVTAMVYQRISAL